MPHTCSTEHVEAYACQCCYAIFVIADSDAAPRPTWCPDCGHKGTVERVDDFWSIIALFGTGLEPRDGGRVALRVNHYGCRGSTGCGGWWARYGRTAPCPMLYCPFCGRAEPVSEEDSHGDE